MSLLTDFARVSKRHPCPICGRPDWCLVNRGQLDSPNRVICARVESACRWGEAGWLHGLHGASGPRPSARLTVALRSPTLAEEAERYVAQVEPAPFARLSAELGVSQSSLRRLEVGWNGWAWSFPMRRAKGQVCGIRLRRPNGSKLCVKGSREGLFIPSGVAGPEMLFICEGPTDTAALLSLGLAAIGRPSCTLGVREVCRFVHASKPASLVIAADGDVPGLEGARALANALGGTAPAIRIVCPPQSCKDVRAWVQGGATQVEVERAVRAQHPIETRIVRRAQ